MARPRKEVKTEYVSFHFDLTTEKAALFRECYRRSGCRSKVQFLCEMLHNYERIEKIQNIDSILFDELLKHRNLLINATSNLNQIAKAVNTLGYSATEGEIKRSLDEVKSILPLLKERSDELLKKSYNVMKKI
jgi:hypothetical protein